MAKVALLIGVSEYEPGLNNLPAAVKDIAAMQRVLQDPEMGGFDQVKLLANPDPQAMQYEIETLFSGRSKDDLVLLFFSGHGIKDDSGRLYFATQITRKNDKGDLIRATAVPTSFVHDIMNTSRCKRQAIILDCCFSGAFDPALQAKDGGSVDLRSQLGAEGRVVLASSSSTEYSFEQQGSDLSLYTRYLVEGIETGAGDRNEDGFVSVLELHEYAASKVQETAPKMTPKIITLKDKGFEIILSKARVTDPKLRYRKAASRYANAGSIRPAGRAYLNSLREQLGLSAEETTAIETEVLRPYQERLKNLQNYREALVAEAEYEYPLSEEACEEMNRLQELWGLRDEDILPIQQGVEAQFFQKSAVYQQHLTEYGQAFTDAIQQGFPLSSQARQGLETLQRSLVLKPEDAAQIEQPLLQQAELKHQEQLRQVEEEKRQQQEQAEYENKLRRYEQELTKAIQADYPLKQFALDRLKTFQQELKLKDEDVDRIEQPLRELAEATYQEQLQQQEQAEQQRQTELEQERQAAEYKQKLQRYEQEFTKAISAQYPLDSSVRDGLNQFQQSLELRDEDVARIERVICELAETKYRENLRQKEEAEKQQQKKLEQQFKIEYEDNLRRYEQEFAKSVEAEYPLSQEAWNGLKKLQQQLNLKDEKDIARVERTIRESAEVKYQNKLRQQKEAEQQRQVELEKRLKAAHEDKRQEESKIQGAIAHNNLGFDLGKQGKLDEAIAAYRKAIQIDPNYANAHNNLGFELCKQGKLDEAIAAHRKAIQIDPNNAIFYNGLGFDLNKQGKLDEEIAAYRKAIQIDPNNAIFYNNLGEALRVQGKLDEAITAFRQAIQIDPNYANAHNNLGFDLGKQGKLDEAIAAYRKAIQIAPNSAILYNNLGEALRVQGKLDEAITAFRQAIQIDPNYENARNNLESALKKQGQGKKFLGLF